MTEQVPYPTAKGVENAIKDSAKKAAAADPSLSVTKRIQLEYFNRFLSRVFSEGRRSEWVLKGGTGLLARVPTTRATRDIDLYRENLTLTQARDDLIRLAAIDLRDHFHFEYASHTDSIGNEAQPYTDGHRVKFNVSIGLASRGALQIDLAIGAGMTGEVVRAEPATALDLPRLTSLPYRLYPVVDQIADKVCATMTDYRDRTSSREKDLVDLVVLAVTHDIEGTALGVAIATEARRRRMPPFTNFTVPDTWGIGYTKLSKAVPYCAGYRTIEAASGLASSLIDPALSRTAEGKMWSHASRAWV